MTDSYNSRQNYLLDALPTAEYERIFPYLELVTMSLGDVLYESGGGIKLRLFSLDLHRIAVVYHGEWRVG